MDPRWIPVDLADTKAGGVDVQKRGAPAPEIGAAAAAEGLPASPVQEQLVDVQKRDAPALEIGAAAAADGLPASPVQEPLVSRRVSAPADINAISACDTSLPQAGAAAGAAVDTAARALGPALGARGHLQPDGSSAERVERRVSAPALIHWGASDAASLARKRPSAWAPRASSPESASQSWRAAVLMRRATGRSPERASLHGVKLGRSVLPGAARSPERSPAQATVEQLRQSEASEARQSGCHQPIADEVMDARTASRSGGPSETPPCNPDEAREEAAAAARVLPLTYDSYAHLHNSIALPLMERTQELGRAYWHFRQAEEMHVAVCGSSSKEALYNAACCLALGAQAQAVANRSPGRSDVCPGMPPVPSSVPAEKLAEARADIAVGLLRQAVAAGYSRAGTLETDPDLQAVRILKPVEFRSLLLMVPRLAGDGDRRDSACRATPGADPAEAR